MGTLTLAGHGGSSATSAIDTTAAGDMWDNFDGTTNSVGITYAAGAKGQGVDNNALFYKSPDLMDGLNITMSYNPQGSNAASEMGYGFNYTGVEGLTVGYASGENKTTKGSEADVSTYYLSYAFGPLTVAYANTEFDSEATTSTADVDFTGYSVAYTVTDEISVAYKVSDTSTPNDSTDADQEVNGVTASYTAGGMTIGFINNSKDNVNGGTTDLEMNELMITFAF